MKVGECYQRLERRDDPINMFHLYHVAFWYKQYTKIERKWSQPSYIGTNMQN